MPKGPKGERRPADVIGNVVHVMRVATGEVAETKPDPAKEHMRRGGLMNDIASRLATRVQPHVTDTLWSIDDLVALVDRWDAAQPRQKPGRKPKAV